MSILGESRLLYWFLIRQALTPITHLSMTPYLMYFKSISVLIIAFSVSAASAAEPFRLVALAESVPDGERELDFRRFGEIQLNNRGQVAFGAVLSSAPTRGGYWAEDKEFSLRRVATERDQAPGTDGLTFSSLRFPRIDDAGRVSLMGETTIFSGFTRTTQYGLWSESFGDGLELIAYSHQQAPGANGAAYSRDFLSAPCHCRPSSRTQRDTLRLMRRLLAET